MGVFPEVDLQVPSAKSPEFHFNRKEVSSEPHQVYKLVHSELGEQMSVLRGAPLETVEEGEGPRGQPGQILLEQRAVDVALVDLVDGLDGVLVLVEDAPEREVLEERLVVLVKEVNVRLV